MTCTLTYFLIFAFTFVSLGSSHSKKNIDNVKLIVPSWLTNVHLKLTDFTPEKLKSMADLIVAKDHSGNFTTVKEAIAAAPDNSKRRFIIYVKQGIYDEIVCIRKKKRYITIVGDGRDSTILTGSLHAKDGIRTYDSATLGVDGIGFMAQDICIRNTAGPANGQAVALRLNSDMSVIYRCRIDAYQDTLYAYYYRQFYRECYITGTVDFICGRATAVFQYCQIVPRKPMKGQNNIITAQSNNETRSNSVFLFQKCNITASADLAPIKGTIKTFLGRPWNALSTVVFMQSFLDDIINPAGWIPWGNKDSRLSTLYYGEYDNRGPGSDTSKRVNWKGFKKITNSAEAGKFTVKTLLLKQDDAWLKSTGVPYQEDL